MFYNTCACKPKRLKHVISLQNERKTWNTWCYLWCCCWVFFVLLLDQKIFSIFSWWCANSCFAQATGVESMFEKCKHTHVVACMAQEDWRLSLMPLQVWIVLNCQATVCQTTPVRNNFAVLSLLPCFLLSLPMCEVNFVFLLNEPAIIFMQLVCSVMKMKSSTC